MPGYTTTSHLLLLLEAAPIYRAQPKPSPELRWQMGCRISALAQDKRIELADIAHWLQEYTDADWPMAELRNLVKLYQCFPESGAVINVLSWSHYRLLMAVRTPEARSFYRASAIEESWSARQLNRQIRAHYYERCQTANHLRIKSHYYIEFTSLALKNPARFSEAQLEDALISRIQDLLLELGAGFTFVGRQKKLVTEGRRVFRVDLVFYHTSLRCYVLVEIKTVPLSHRDIGQLDGYVRLFDARYKAPDDEPTLGLLLCPYQDESIKRYSLLHDNHRVFAATYLLELPVFTSYND